MRITTQSAVELPTAPTAAKSVPATPSSAANFGAALAVASAVSAPTSTHNTPDRVAEKKTNHSKTTDADDSASASQAPPTQLANVPPPMPTSLGPTATVQNAAPEISTQTEEADNNVSSDLSVLPSFSTAAGKPTAASILSTTTIPSTPSATASSVLPTLSQGLPTTPVASLSPAITNATPATTAASTAQASQDAATSIPQLTPAPQLSDALQTLQATPAPATPASVTVKPATNPSPMPNMTTAQGTTPAASSLPQSLNTQSAQTAPTPTQTQAGPAAPSALSNISAATTVAPSTAKPDTAVISASDPTPQAPSAFAATTLTASTTSALLDAAQSSTAPAPTQTQSTAANIPAPFEISSISTVSMTNPVTTNADQTSSVIATTPQSAIAPAPLSLAASTKTASVSDAQAPATPTPADSTSPSPTNSTPVIAANIDASPAPQFLPGANTIPANASVAPAPTPAQLASADQNAAAAQQATNLSTLPTLAPPPSTDVIQNVTAPTTFGKLQLAALTLAPKDANPKQSAVSSKDRSVAADLKDKHKSDDPADQSSTTAVSGTSSDAKPTDSNPQFSQSGSGQQTAQHQASTDQILQQAVQAPISVAPTTSHNAPPAMTAAQASTSAPATQSVPVSAADVSASTAVNSAQLVQSIHQSDMRLGMHSPDFGAISINTSLTHQTLSAQISTDHAELSRALAMHLPSIEEKLGNAYGIHAKVEVRDSSTASYGDSSQQQSQSQQAKGNRRGQSGQGGGSFGDNTAPALAAMTAFSSSSASVASSDARLDIRI